ncbi:MAG TPA: penicillin-binding protein 1C [Steroidobacteraceae bacterium]|jgi:penicillin-binding protein 1C|nr:penicillin-binding protein 1C [Steroidobacteraceae bacterium]
MGRSARTAALKRLRGIRAACFRRRRWLAAALVAALGAGIAFFRLLPAVLFDQPLSYVVEARDGTLLSARIASDGQWRFPPLAVVPPKFRRAVLVYEDKRFDSHLGVDALAMARALRLNLGAGHVVSGGSTITMQLARLTRSGDGRGDVRSYGEKAVETLLALRLECRYEKDEILALYASHAPFGGNVVGLEAAAWRYFGRAPADLSWAEAATLAVLPNNPALVNLQRNRDRLQFKRDGLLRRLHDSGDLAAMDLSLALSEPLIDQPHDLPDLAPHLLDTLRAQYPDRHRLRTTLDARLQASASQQVREHSAALARQNVFNAAALVVDNTTFEVLAYVGNSAATDELPRGHAVDIIRRPRSTGSILKPMLYAAMLEDGSLTPRMLLPDVPTHYDGFSPENFDHQYRGAVPADEALAHSLNVPAVRMLKTYGVARFADLLRAAGMSTLTRQADDYGLTLILGGAEGNLWDVSSMYASLAGIARAGAAERAPRFHELRVLRDTAATERGPSTIGTGAAWLTLDTLLEVPRPGEEGHWRNFAGSRAIAWKTGTSLGLRDGWAVGDSSRYTVGVWVGNANGEGRPGLTGSAMAAPLMFALFNGLPASPWFDLPTHALRTMEVCANDGFLAIDGCEVTRMLVPRDSHFDALSPHNLRVNLDGNKQRVDSDCESPGNMRQANWFVLPPGEEFYFRRTHAEYRPLPALRADCAAANSARASLALLYPDANARVLIPRELDGSRGRTVFEAVSRRREATIYWHLDGQYLGETHTFHQQSLDMDPGEHILTLVDDAGERVARRFQVVATR